MKFYVLLISTILISAFALAQSAAPLAPPTALSVAVVDDDTPAQRHYEDNVRPLSGVQSYDLGTRTDRMNILTPAFSFSETYGTNPGLISGSQNSSTSWGSTSNVGGSAQLMRGNAKQLFSMSYQGSAQLSSFDSRLNTQIHSLEVTEAVTAGRWTYLLGDTLTYQPNALAAYGPLLYPGSNTGTPGSDLRPGVATNNSILTQQASQLDNSVLGQVTYGLSRVSMLTGSASYGTLHYLEGDLLDTSQFTGTGGYDHRFGRNTLGMSYSYSKFMFNNLAADFDTSTIHVAYGRRIIGRVSFAGGIGPTFRTTSLGGICTTKADVTGQASLHYAGNRTTLGLAYSRAVTAGSGVTAGALTNSISATVERTLTRTLTGNFDIGYARNSAGDQSGAIFNTLYFATGVSHMIGRNISFSIGYRGQKQTSTGNLANLSTHSVAVSILWHFRPIRLQ